MSAPKKTPYLTCAIKVGPGWVLGSTECLAGLEPSASTIAGTNFSSEYLLSIFSEVSRLSVTSCSLHFISFKQISALETIHPLLILKLYKLLSSLLAKRQELTIGQLGTLHSIINSPPPKRHPGKRLSMVSKTASFFS